MDAGLSANPRRTIDRRFGIGFTMWHNMHFTGTPPYRRERRLNQDENTNLDDISVRPWNNSKQWPPFDPSRPSEDRKVRGSLETVFLFRSRDAVRLKKMSLLDGSSRDKEAFELLSHTFMQS